MSGAQKQLMDKYGFPDLAYQTRHCEVWEVKKDFSWFPAKKFMVNKDFKKMLFKAFSNLEKAGLHREIKTFDGCYNPRSVRGGSALSLHAWAAAIDLNAAIEKLGQEKTNFSGSFIAIMKAAGIFWGGHYLNRKDPMHFSMLNG
jgi:D-alanyl-D-alanine carboxypeptidase